MDFSFHEVNDVLESIDASIEDFSWGLRQRGLKKFQTTYFVEARYAYQVWELEIHLRKGRIETSRDIEMLVDDFHSTHESVFAVKEPGQQVECVNWKGRLTAFLDRARLEPASADGRKLPSPDKQRGGFFRETGEVEFPAYTGDALRPGIRIFGPAVIEEPTTTLVVYPHSSVMVTPYNNYMIEVT